MKKWIVIVTVLVMPIVSNAMNRVGTTARQIAQQAKTAIPTLRNAVNNVPHNLERASDKLVKLYQTHYSKIAQNLREAENRLRNRDPRLYDEYIKQFRNNNRLSQLSKLNQPLTRAQKEVLFGLDKQMLQSLDHYLTTRTTITKLEKLGHNFIPRNQNVYSKNTIHQQKVKKVLEEVKRNQNAQYLLQDQLKTALLENYNPQLIQQLIDAGATINTSFIINPLAVTDQKISNLLKAYQDDSAIIDAITNADNLQFFTPFDSALSHNNLELLALLLQNGFDPKMRDFDGQRPIDKALKKGASAEFICMLSGGTLPKNKQEKSETIIPDKSYFESAKEWVKSWIW